VVEEDYPGAPVPRGLRRVVRRWRLGLLKYHYHLALGMLAVLGGLALLAVGLSALLRTVRPGPAGADPGTSLALSRLGSLGTLVVSALGGRWRNLHRWTDPLGGPVPVWPERGTPWPFRSSDDPGSWRQMPTAGQQEPPVPVTRPVTAGIPREDAVGVRTGDDVRLRDPATVQDSGWHPRSPLRGHSGYYDDPVFDEVVADLVREVTARPADPVPAQPAAPAREPAEVT
jgi:hypothetical protein